MESPSVNLVMYTSIHLFFYIHLSSLLQPSSKASTVHADLHKFRFSAICMTSDSEAVRIFTSTGHITHPFAGSDKPFVFISFGIGIRSSHSFIGTDLFSRQSLLLGLLLFFLQNSHFVGSRHQEQSAVKSEKIQTHRSSVCSFIVILSAVSKQNHGYARQMHEEPHCARETLPIPSCRRSYAVTKQLMYSPRPHRIV